MHIIELSCLGCLRLSLGFLGLFLSQCESLFERTLSLASARTTFTAHLVGDNFVLAVDHLHQLLAALPSSFVHLSLLRLVTLFEPVGKLCPQQGQVCALERRELGGRHQRADLDLAAS